ncbi:DUF2264 domain-containing protein [Streptomyces sp. 8P21H-1]|uniref:DUF2264 domain-containing protein n=1 Tax=Streptomyces sp. 8P21H-1 TaxID=2737048 RepID=UPI00156DEFE9|nr:DUF2264 domain-containing protein [Streptomyces sp. 8P21H-1]NSL42698.1 DUF2264 domain-containing protein [Streptomyces sp. 8P21H-1]
MTIPFPLPPEDRELSPYTRWSRAHWEAVADGMLTAAWRWATPEGALLDLPGRPAGAGVRTDGLEGFARTFLTAAFRVAGAKGDDPHGWLERYADGLAAGTRTPGRDDTESWPLILDHLAGGQPMVESASVALGLTLTAPWLWKHLDSGVQDRTEEWLRDALYHTPAPNNWHLFPYTVAGFLESVGRGDAKTAAARERARRLLEGWYAGDGWYSDGDGRAFDHYNGWALHLYPTLDAFLHATDAEPYGSRLREHLDSFALTFAANGAPLYFGRSLTYRFGASAAVALGAVTGHTPLSPGTSRRIISGSLRHFLDRGALTEDGLLSLGWYGPHEATLQTYSGPSSPYWASKAFVALLAPAGHPLWTDPEEPAPVEAVDRAVALPAPGLLIQSTCTDGIVRLHNHGSDHVRPHDGESAAEDDPLYGRQAYSTHTGPTASKNIADNHLSVEVDGRGSVRRRIHPLGAGGGNGWGWGASWHRPVFATGAPMVPGLRVESVTVVKSAFELRIHRVLGAPVNSRVTQTGWATGLDNAVVSSLYGLHGWDDGLELLRAPQGTAYTRWAQVPRIAGAAGGTTLHVSLAALTVESIPLEEAVTNVEVEDGTVRVTWADDGTRSVVGFKPVAVSLS